MELDDDIDDDDFHADKTPDRMVGYLPAWRRDGGWEPRKELWCPPGFYCVTFGSVGSCEPGPKPLHGEMAASSTF